MRTYLILNLLQKLRTLMQAAGLPGLFQMHIECRILLPMTHVVRRVL